MTASLSTQDALIAVMIATSAADQNQTTAELLSIEQEIDSLPAFADYDKDRIPTISQTIMDLLEEEDGLDALLGLVNEALPDRFNETAYALACDIAAEDSPKAGILRSSLRQTHLRLLKIITALVLRMPRSFRR